MDNAIIYIILLAIGFIYNLAVGWVENNDLLNGFKGVAVVIGVAYTLIFCTFLDNPPLGEIAVAFFFALFFPVLGDIHRHFKNEKKSREYWDKWGDVFKNRGR